MRYDDVAWEASDNVSDSWAQHLLNPDVSRSIGDLLLKHHDASDAIQLAIQARGGFNIAFRMELCCFSLYFKCWPIM